MTKTDRQDTPHRNVLVVGASRGLGEAVVESYVARGAHVVGTARKEQHSPLHDLAARNDSAVEVEQVDITVPADPAGTIAVMSSGQGSVSGNTTGGFEVYRATTSALNQMFRSYAARHAGKRRTLLLMAPGWVRTGLGGPNAMLEIDESIPPLVDTIDAQHGTPGLQYLDRHGAAVAW